MSRKCPAPTFFASNSPCRCNENPCGTFTVVQSLYSDPAVSVSVERETTWPENGSRWNIQSNALSILSAGTFHATSAPSARLVASNVWRTRRIVPARNIVAIRAITTSTSTLERRAISSNGSRTKPAILSSEMARIFALIGSLCSTGSMRINPPGAEICPTLPRSLSRLRPDRVPSQLTGKARPQSDRPCRQGQTEARRNGGNEGDRSQKIICRSYKRCLRPRARSTPETESRSQGDDSRSELTNPSRDKETSTASDDAMDRTSPS